MKILDSKGRLFGSISILDLGAALIIVLVIIGIFFFPGTSGTSIAGQSGTKQIELDAIVRGLSVRDPNAVLSEFDKSKKANLIIRKVPHGQIDIKSVQQLPRTLIIPQPDGTAKVVPDPRTDVYSADMLMTLTGKATITQDGAVLGGEKIKIGVPIELEGFNYSFNASVIDVRIKE